MHKSIVAIALLCSGAYAMESDAPRDVEELIESMAFNMRMACQLVADPDTSPLVRKQAQTTIDQIRRSPHYPKVKKFAARPIMMSEVEPETPRFARRKSELSRSMSISKKED